jgi:hypothetical protein
MTYHNPLCKYRNIFGKPGKGIHSIRICNIAVVDVLLTVLGAYIISKYSQYSFACVLFTLFILGIILHRAFCVKTTVDRFIFGN